jgi:hypothetical protein
VTRLKWKLVLVYLEIVLVSVQDRCMDCAKCTIASEIVWTHWMLLLDDEAQMEAHFGPFGYSANLDSRYLHGLRRMYHMLGNHFGHTRWNS